MTPGTVWDCVLLNDELDLLEFRPGELDGVVDRFVVVEAAQTFTGPVKPLHFQGHRRTVLPVGSAYRPSGGRPRRS